MDTSVIIDLYRGYPPAAAWVQHNAGLRLGLALYTRNLKHFAPLLGGLVKQPY